jgi:hypothetical protein
MSGIEIEAEVEVFAAAGQVVMSMPINDQPFSMVLSAEEARDLADLLWAAAEQVDPLRGAR